MQLATESLSRYRISASLQKAPLYPYPVHSLPTRSRAAVVVPLPGGLALPGLARHECSRTCDIPPYRRLPCRLAFGTLTPAVRTGSVFLFPRGLHSVVQVYQPAASFSSVWTRGLCPVWGSYRKAPRNTRIRVFLVGVSFHFSWGMSGCGVAGSWGRGRVTFIRNCQPLP